MRRQTLLGLVIVIIGLNVLFNVINISTRSFVAPLIFFVLGMFFYQRKHSLLSIIFFVISATIFFDQILGVNFFGLLIACVALYYGFRLVRSTNQDDEHKRERRRKRQENSSSQDSKLVDLSKSFDDYSENDHVKMASECNDKQSTKQREYIDANIRRGWIGDIHYTGEAFELTDVTIWNGIGDVRFDLSKAIIPEGETIIIVQAIIGQIDFYVPDDLALTVQASAMIGDVSLFHEKHGGINKQLSIAKRGYKQAPRRVRLVLSTVIGEVKVKVV